MMKRVGVGIIGAGFISDTRARCYRAVHGYEVDLVAVADIDADSAGRFAARHRVGCVATDARDVLARDDVDMVDLCVPNSLHKDMVLLAAAAGKHVVCAKPLTGFFGQGMPREEVARVPRREMLRRVTGDAREMVSAAERAGVRLMYAENWVYAPAVQKAKRLIEACQGPILEIRGGERHSGSHSPYSKLWQSSGGGALLRLGIHSIGAAIYLKSHEGLVRSGRPIRPVAVMGDVANMEQVTGMRQQKRQYLVSGWQDVENWGVALVTFGDGSRAILHGADTALGGMESKLEIVLSDARIECNMGPSNLCVAYAPDESVFASEYLTEKQETKAGWSFPAPDEEWALGHYHQIQDFVQSVADDRRPISDGQLGLDAVEVAYAAYVSAEEGRRVVLADIE